MVNQAILTEHSQQRTQFTSIQIVATVSPVWPGGGVAKPYLVKQPSCGGHRSTRAQWRIQFLVTYFTIELTSCDKLICDHISVHHLIILIFE